MVEAFYQASYCSAFFFVEFKTKFKWLAQGSNRRKFTWIERTAEMVIISSEHPSSFEDKIILEIIGSYKAIRFKISNQKLQLR